jgi:Rad3-related DNA helicase
LTYDNFKITREENQKNIVDIFKNSNIGDINIIESPTGSGKTFIDLKAALEYRKKYNSAVIISTNTNFNALAIKNTFLNDAYFKQYFEEDIFVSTEIGKNNYIDLQRLVDTLTTMKKPFNIHNLTLEYINATYSIEGVLKNDVLIDDFAKDLNLSSEQVQFLNVYAQDSTYTINPKELKSIERKIENKEIIIVNHSYLLILYRFYGNNKNKSISNEFKELFFNTSVILDEFHTLFDSAKSIFSNSFSLFRLKYSIDGVINNISEENNKTLLKSLKYIQNSIQTCYERVIKDNDNILEYLAYLKNDLGAKRLNIIKDKLNAIQDYDALNETELSKYARFAYQEINELNVINLRSKKFINIELSPKGYPRISIDTGFPSYKLRESFWSKSKGSFLCMSGTLRTSTTISNESFSWSTKRNGLFINDEASLKERLYSNQELNEDTKEYILDSNSYLNERIDSIKYKAYGSLFEKSKLLFTVIDNDAFRLPKASDTTEIKTKKLEEWKNNIGIFISNNLKFNALVLSTSYDDVKAIARTIRENRPDIEVFEAIEGESMQNLVDRYKDATKNSLCCLVGTEQYYTGLDLKGDFLQELYIAKIPFKPYKGQIGIKVFPQLNFTKDENYFNETLIKFIQGFGRATRDYEDKAIVYLLDPRLNDKSRVMYKNFLNEKGIEIKYLDMEKKYKQSLLGISSKCQIDNSLYLLFFDYMISKSINEICNIFEIQTSEAAEVNKAVLKILNEDININSIYTKNEFKTLLESKSYGNIWNLLLKIYVVGLKSKGINLEKKIQENKMYGYTNLTDLSKYILLEENMF